MNNNIIINIDENIVLVTFLAITLSVNKYLCEETKVSSYKQPSMIMTF